MKTKRYHIIVDIENAPEQIVKDKKGLKKFLTDFPPKIGMSTIYGPVVVDGVPEDPGISGFVVIDYSHISVHTFTPNNDALVDIFSCKPYDKKIVIAEVLKYFKVSKSQTRIKQVWWG